MKVEILEYIMMLFERHYCLPDEVTSDDSNTIARQYLLARVADGTYEAELFEALETGDVVTVKKIAKPLIDSGFDEYAEPLVRRALEVEGMAKKFQGMARRLENRMARGLKREKIASDAMPSGPIGMATVEFFERLAERVASEREQRKSKAEAAADDKAASAD